MAWTKGPVRLAPFSLSLLLSLTGAIGLPSQAQAQVQPVQISENSRIRWERYYTPPPGAGAPDRRTGAGTRGNCIRVSDEDLPKLPVLLVASSSKVDPELTVAARPTFFWYMPDAITSRVEFTLSDENGEDILTQTLAVKDKPGVTSFSLADSTEKIDLKLNQLYQWSVTIRCHAQDRSGDLTAKGSWIKRVPKSRTLQQNLAQTRNRNQVVSYAQERIWYETLSTLAALRRSRPQDSLLAADWKGLLQAVGMDRAVTQAPLCQKSLVESNTSAQKSLCR